MAISEEVRTVDDPAISNSDFTRSARLPGWALDERYNTLRAAIDKMSEALGVRYMPVGLVSHDGLNIFVDNLGSYHFTLYERGRLVFDRVGELDDIEYWYCRIIVATDAAREFKDRKERFKYEYEILGDFGEDWAKRRVHELAAMFRAIRPQDIALLPDIGEPL